MKIFELYKLSIKMLFFSIFLIVLMTLLIIDKKIVYLSDSINSNNKVIFFIGLIICFVFYLILISNRFSNKQYNNVKIIILFIILFFVQIVFAYSIYFYTGWDASTIRNTAFLIVEHPQEVAKQYFMYYSYFTYQTTIATIMGYILRLFYNLNISNYYFMLVVFNVFLVNISCLFSILSIHRLFNNSKITSISMLLISILILFSPWIVIPYTDTFLLIIPSLIFYLYTFIKDTKSDIFIWFIIIMLSIVGTLIKAQSIIILIALIIDKILKTITNFKIFKLFQLILIFIIVFVGIDFKNFIYNELENDIDYNIVQGREFTYTHFLMTGLNPDTYGVFSDNDSSISYATGSIEERENANWEIINERINKMGIFGYLNFSLNKVLVNFNDGTFSWGGEGGFYVHYFEDKTPASNFLKKLFYNNGELYYIYQTITQTTWLILLFVILLNILSFKDNFKIEILLTLIGLFLFVHLFEARARYLIGYLPIFIVSFAFGLNELSKLKFLRNNKLLSK